MESFLKLKKKNLKDTHDRGIDTYASHLDSNDIYSSQIKLNSIEDFEDEETKESNEALNSLNVKQQLLKKLMNKGYSMID